MDFSQRRSLGGNELVNRRLQGLSRLTAAREDIGLGQEDIVSSRRAIDGDTLESGRLTGFDTFESTADLGMNTKAKKIADLGLSLADQKKLGIGGKHALEAYIKANPMTEMEATGFDVYGRPLLKVDKLTDYMIGTGTAVPTDRTDTKRQELYRRTQEKINRLDPEIGRAMEIQREYNIDPQKPSIPKRIGEAVDAFQSGTQQALAGTADFVLDVVTPGDNTLLNKAKSTEYANEVWGYDSREADFAKKEALHKFKNKEYVGSVMEMAKSPELWGESLPMIAEMAVGAGKFTALGSKLIKAGTQGLKGAERIAEAKRIRDGATAMEKATLLGAENAGFLGVVGDQTNRHIEEFTANNNGVGPTYGQIAGMTAMNVLQLGLDRMAFGQLIATKGGIQALKDTVMPILKVVPDNALGTIAKKVATTATGITAAMGTEATQEYLQTWAEMLNAKAGTTKYGDWMAVLQNPEVQDEAIIGALAGAGMGGQMRSVAEVPGVVGIANTGLNKLAEVSTGRTKTDILAKNAAKNAQAEAVRDAVGEGTTMSDTASMTTQDKLNELDVLEAEIRSYEGDGEDYTAELKDIEDRRKRYQQELDHEANTNVEPVASTQEGVPTTVDETPTYDVETDVKQQAVEAGIDAEDAVVRARMTGISKLKSLYDKTSKLKVELLQSTGLKNLGSKKPKAYNVGEVIDDSTIDLVLRNEGIDPATIKADTLQGQRLQNALTWSNNAEHSQDKIRTETKKVYDSIKEGNELDTVIKDILPDGEKVTPANVARLLAISIAATQDGINGEMDLSKAADLENTGFTREDTLATQIAERYVNSFGVRVSGEKTQVARVHKEMGTKILKFMEVAGIITRPVKGKERLLKNVSNKNNVDEKGNRLKNGSTVGVVATEGKSIALPVVEFTKDYKPTYEVKVNKEGEKYTSNSAMLNTTVRAMQQMNKLFNPVNSAELNTDAQDDVTFHKSEGSPEVKIADEHKSVVIDYSAVKYKVPPHFIKFFDELHSIYKSPGVDGKWDTFLNLPEVAALLGKKKSGSWLLGDSEAGQWIGRSGSLAKLLASWDDVKNKNEGEGFNYSYESAINERIHVIQSILEYQGDKYMSRNIVTHDPVEVSGSNLSRVKKEVVGELAKLSKVVKGIQGKKATPDQVLEGILQNEYVQKLMMDMKTNGTISMRGLALATENLGMFKGKSPFKLLNLLSALYDLSQEKNGVVTTGYRAQVDASASGAVNTLLNLVGIPRVRDLVKALMTGDGTSVYSEVQSIVNTLLAKVDSGLDPARSKQKELEDVLPSEDVQRDLVKYFVIPWLYGESPKNTQVGFGKAIANSLLEAAVYDGNQKVYDFINSKLETSDFGITAVPKEDAKYYAEAKEVSTIIDSNKYVMYDTETTGYESNPDAEVVQIGAVKVINGKNETFEMFLPPLKPVDKGEGSAYKAWSSSLQKTYNAWEKASKSKSKEELVKERNKVKALFERFIGDLPTLAHNSSFDDKMVLRMGMKLKSKDTLALARYMRGSGNASMKALAKSELGKDNVEEAHSALVDSETMYEVFTKLKFKDRSKDGRNISDMTEKELKTLSNYFTEDLSKVYADAVTEAYPEIVNYRRLMKEIYDMLEKTGKWNGTIGSAMSAVLGTTDKMSIQKLKSTVLQDLNDESGVPLTVNQFMNNATSFMVNLQHSTDAAILLLTLQRLMADGKIDGTMTVHDALYPPADKLDLVIKYYNEAAAEVAIKYDYVNAALNELETAIKEMEKDGVVSESMRKELADWREENNELMAEKEAWLGEQKLNVMDDFVDTIQSYNDRKGTKVGTKPNSASDKVRKAKQMVDDIRSKTDLKGIIGILEGMDLTNRSKALLDRIKQAVEKGVTIEHGKEFSAIPGKVFLGDVGEHPVTKAAMKPDAMVEVLAHEVDHAIQLDWIIKNPNSNEVKFLQQVVSRLAGKIGKVGGITNPAMIERIGHLLNPIEGSVREDLKKAYQIAELSSMMNEEAFENMITEQFPVTVVDKVLQAIKDLVGKAYAAMTGKQLDDLDIDYTMIKEVLTSLQNETMAAYVNDLVDANVPSARYTGEKAVNKAEEIMGTLGEKIQAGDKFGSDFLLIWGDALYENFAPKIGYAHEHMKRSSKLYKQGSQVLSNIFYEGDFAQRMHTYMGIAGDNLKELYKQALTIHENYKQETRELAEAAKSLHRDIEKMYTEAEGVTVWDMVNNTGMAGIDSEVWNSIVRGDVTLDQAMTRVKNTLTTEEVTTLDELAQYYNTHQTTTGNTNVEKTGILKEEAYEYVALKAMTLIPGIQAVLDKTTPEMGQELKTIADTNRTISDQINRKKLGVNGEKYSDNAVYNIEYDGTFSMDILGLNKEVVAVTKAEMKEMMKDGTWEVVTEPAEDGYGVLVRDNYSPGRVEGVGLELNRYVNGVMIKGDKARDIQAILSKHKNPKAWLLANNLVQDGFNFRLLVSKENKIKYFGMERHASASLYRTFIHNKDLVSSEVVRDMMLAKGTRIIKSAKDMDNLEAIVKHNYEVGLRGKRKVVEPLIHIAMAYNNVNELLTKYPMIAKYYKIPENITTFNRFNEKVQLVKRGEAEALLGHENYSKFKNNHPKYAQMEKVYKQLLSLVKQRMIVLAPVKLAKDTISNMAIMSVIGMSPREILVGMKDSTVKYKEYADERTKLVSIEVDIYKATTEAERKVATRLRDIQKKKVEGMKFHQAYEAGFIQTLGTSVLSHDIDTISGLQNDIKTMIDKYTHTKDGDSNALYKSIKWWMKAGYNIEDILEASGKLAKEKNQTVGEAMLSMAENVRNKKDDRSVAEYISEILMLPGSTAVNVGGAYMVASDTISKYTMQQWLLTQMNHNTGKKHTVEEASERAMNTFVDYRKTIPSEIKMLSDYGILMFPSFWINMQKVIAGLITYHPLSMGISYGIAAAMDQENTHIVTQNLASKFDSHQGIFHMPGSVLWDWFKDIMNG